MPTTTQRDIARLAGCSQMTISRVLRGDPAVSPATRERVWKLVNETGYTPDPMLSALVSYKRSSKALHLRASIAVIANEPNRDPAGELTMGGIRRACKSMGFGLEETVFDSSKMRPDRQCKILQARGVQGIIWPTSRINVDPPEPLFDISTFAAIAIGFNFTKHPINAVNLDYPEAARMAFERCLARGYRRIGLVVARGHDHREGRAHSAVLALMKSESQTKAFCQPLLFSDTQPTTAAEFARWYSRESPDAIVTGYGGRLLIRDYFKANGLTIPHDCAVASLDVMAHSGFNDSGVQCHRELWGEIAVNAIYTMLKTGEKGIPHLYRKILIQPRWQDGDSLPNRN